MYYVFISGYACGLFVCIWLHWICFQINAFILLVFVGLNVHYFKSHNLIIVDKTISNITGIYCVVIARFTCDLFEYDYNYSYCLLKLETDLYFINWNYTPVCNLIIFFFFELLLNFIVLLILFNIFIILIYCKNA